MTVPAVVIAAPASGSGKTTVATGLMGALRRAGHRVAPYKVGPDYIDPGYHTVAAGRPGRNLDPVLVGAEQVVPLYRHGAHECDVAVVEGVMGLFDGRIVPQDDPIAPGSTAQVASLLGAPVILVVDVRGHSQSLAALLHGFASYATSVRLGGVILNQVGSARHEQVLRTACARVGLPVLGVVPRLVAVEVPSRHLGLIPAAEHGAAATAAVTAMTDLVAAHVDCAALVDLAVAPPPGPIWSPENACDPSPTPAESGERPVLALAGGSAFTFGYPEHREMLTAAGAHVVVFDPLRDRLPDDTAGLVLPGGFPEEQAGELAANTVLRTEVAALAREGMPIHAECAGMLYLAQALDGHPMVGILDGTATFGPRLTLGYRDAVALTDSPLWGAGDRVTGHEFHRTQFETSCAQPAWGWHSPAGAVRAGVVQQQIHASYLHTHPAGNPQAVRRFVTAAAHFARTRGRGKPA